MTAAPVPEGIHLPLVWVGMEELPIQMASQMLIQIQSKDEVILALGQTSPPVLLGDAGQQAAQASDIPFIPVKCLVRTSLTTTRLRELVSILTEGLAKHDEMFSEPEGNADVGN